MIVWNEGSRADSIVAFGTQVRLEKWEKREKEVLETTLRTKELVSHVFRQKRLSYEGGAPPVRLESKSPASL